LVVDDVVVFVVDLCWGGFGDVIEDFVDCGVIEVVVFCVGD